jgi:hypothetical protein
MKLFICRLVLLVAAVSAGAVSAEVRIHDDGKGQVIEVAGLADASDCHPFEFGGTIVKRDFADDALTLTGIVIEANDGTREFFNIEIPKSIDMALKGNVYVGLQRLTQIGRKANGRAFACGAAGRVQILDALK